MIKKVGWLLSSLLLVSAMLLTSCGKSEPTTSTPTPTTTTTTTTTATSTTPATTTTTTPGVEMVKDSLGRMVEKPKYGGIINLSLAGNTLPGWAPQSYSTTTAATYPQYEPLFIEDWAKGPSGTNEITLDSSYTPLTGLTGCLGESWEQPDLSTIIVHLKKGIRFQNRPLVLGREMVADDVVFSFNMMQNEARSEWYLPPGTSEDKKHHATALGKWTVQFKLKEPNAFAAMQFIKDVIIMPHEIWDKYQSYEDWRNACGTGAFMVEDVVTGTYVSYKKNPDYWQDDPFFPQNKLPYVDGIRFQLISDTATRLAALRTGKLDRVTAISWEDAKQLKKTNPEQKWRKLFPTGSIIAYSRNENAPFTDLRVRQALSIAINYGEIKDKYYGGEAEILTWPLMPNAGDAYTPVDQLPTQPLIKGSTISCKELFSYSTVKAKQLLKEAGYPSGSKLILETTSAYSDLASLLKTYWDAVGMITEIQLMESGAYASYTMSHQFKMTGLGGWGNANPLYAFEYAYRDRHPWNNVWCNDAYIDSTWDTIKTTLDPEKRTKMWKDLNLYAIEQAYYMPLPGPYVSIFWQPWLKGYSGELYLGRIFNSTTFSIYSWVDQDLKESMTGRR